MPRVKKTSGRNPPLHAHRRESDYQRRPGRKPPRGTFLIVCESSQTEPNYFESLREAKRLANMKVIKGRGRIPLARLLQVAENEMLKLDWNPNLDQAWCIFDIEREGTHSDLEEIRAIAKQKKIYLGVSNPCFEYWFLLHFAKTGKPYMDANELIRDLYQHLPGYEKSQDHFSILKERTSLALQYSEELRSLSENNWDDFPNPSSTVDQLVRLIWTGVPV